MIGNILKKPDEAKFRRINLANAAFTKRVGAVPGGITFLTAVGYVKDDGENALVRGADCDMEIVRQGDAELGGYIAKMAPPVGRPEMQALPGLSGLAPPVSTHHLSGMSAIGGGGALAGASAVSSYIPTPVVPSTMLGGAALPGGALAGMTGTPGMAGVSPLVPNAGSIAGSMPATFLNASPPTSPIGHGDPAVVAVRRLWVGRDAAAGYGGVPASTAGAVGGVPTTQSGQPGTMLGGMVPGGAPTSLSTAGAAAGGHLGSSSYGVEGGAVTSGAAPGGLLNTTGGVAVEQDTNIEDGGLDYLAWLRMAGGDVFMNSDGGLFEEEAQAPPH